MDIHKRVTQQLMQALQSGKVPWRKPWSNDPNTGLPTNITNTVYQGINYILLNFVAVERNYIAKWWGTRRQWQSVGGQVKKNSKSASVIVWREVEGHETLATHKVFNLAQVVEGELDKFQVTQHDPLAHPDYERAERLIAATGVRIKHEGNKSAYIPPVLAKTFRHGDYIRIPSRRQFVAARDYYETMFHELAHWSEIRRKLQSMCRVMRELIAEISSCFVVSALGLPHSDDLDQHDQYLQEWLKEMGNDPTYIFTAALEATKTANFLLAFEK